MSDFAIGLESIDALYQIYEGINIYEMKSMYLSRLVATRNRTKIETHSISVLWAPSNPTRGAISLQAFKENNDKMLEYAKENKGVKLYVKFHPDQSDDQLLGIEKYECEDNIVFIDKQQNLLDFIDSVYMVLSTLSLALLDAMARGIPAISLADELALRLLRKDLPIIVYKQFDDFKRLISEQLNSREAINVWKENIVKMQDEFLSNWIMDESDIKKKYTDMINEQLSSL